MFYIIVKWGNISLGKPIAQRRMSVFYMEVGSSFVTHFIELATSVELITPFYVCFISNFRVMNLLVLLMMKRLLEKRKG